MAACTFFLQNVSEPSYSQGDCRRFSAILGVFYICVLLSGCGSKGGEGSKASNFPQPATPDLSAPTTTLTCSPPANAKGWNREDVTCDLSALDNPGGSGVKEIRYRVNDGAEVISPGNRTAVILKDEGENLLIYFAVDQKLNEEIPKFTKAMIDKTLPTVSATVSPSPNQNGWNSSNATVSFSCSDKRSGIAACPAEKVITVEGKGQNITGTAVDQAGNEASTSVTVNLDKTPPLVSSTDPKDKSVEVNTTSDIIAVFSEEMDPLSLNQDTFIVRADGIRVSGQVIPNGAMSVFRPISKLFFSTSYTVTLTSGIRDPAGHRLAEHIWSFETRDRKWGRPQSIEINEAPASNPQLAGDDFGNAIAVWVQGEDVWANLYRSGSGWDPQNAARIESRSQPAGKPRIAADPKGNAMAAWEQGDQIWARPYRVGLGWDPAGAVRIDANTGVASNPAVAMGSNESAVAVWEQLGEPLLGSPDKRPGVWANRYSLSSGWSLSPTDLRCAGCLVSAGLPGVAGDGLGNAIAVWVQAGHIWANRHALRSGWSRVNSTQIESNTGTASYPYITMDGFGNAMALWIQEEHVWANRFDAGTLKWGNPAQIETNPGVASSARIALDDFGNAMAVWVQGNDIWANRYVGGSGWSPKNAGLIEASNGAASDPQIAIDGSGNAVAAWVQDKGIWANRYLVGKGWVTPAMISDAMAENATGSPTDPRVAIDLSGNAIVIWAQPDEKTTSILANRLE